VDEDISTEYEEVHFHVSDSYPDGEYYSIEKVSQVRRIYCNKFHRDKYLYFVKVLISHPDGAMLDNLIYNAGVQVTVNYSLDTPFITSASGLDV